MLDHARLKRLNEFIDSIDGQIHTKTEVLLTHHFELFF